ncbi:MAG: PCRF domain-containing protein, partial [Oscillospiraceae bacterium]|nr:PCRF domain-containing protein [Oscillospiraceae bacterium]
MIDKLEMTVKRYDEINEKLSDAEVINDQDLYRALMREHKNLTPVVEKYSEFKSAKAEFEEARQMLSEGGLDAELKEMAQVQFDENKRKIAECEEELKILLLPRDPDDDRSVIVEIRGGAGGEEAALFANSLYRMYTMYAALKGWRAEIINSNPTELGGFKEISFSVEGEGVYAKMKYESGVHRVQRVPETESQGRVHTSTITVAVLPEVEEVDVEINPADLTFQTFRAGGAGGQHVNKTESAIRIIHQ